MKQNFKLRIAKNVFNFKINDEVVSEGIFLWSIPKDIPRLLLKSLTIWKINEKLALKIKENSAQRGFLIFQLNKLAPKEKPDLSQFKHWVSKNSKWKHSRDHSQNINELLLDKLVNIFYRNTLLPKSGHYPKIYCQSLSIILNSQLVSIYYFLWILCSLIHH